MPSQYAAFLQSLSCAGIVADEIRAKKSELEMQSLYFAGHLGREFIGTRKERIVIKQFGEWNHGPGPDFLNCAVEIDGILHTGPIELDSTPGDWEAHGHATNPAFDEVVLHLTLAGAARETFTRTSEHWLVTQAIIPEERLDQLLPPNLAQAPVSLGRCYQPLREMPLGSVESLMKEAALHRALQKAGQLQCVIDSHGYPQALWQALANALGYHKNRLAMTLLAQRAPLSQLRNISALDRSAHLFGVAGFLNRELSEAAPEDSRRWLQNLWTSWWKNRPHPDPRPLPWTLAGIRPMNHPQRRLAALAATLSIWPSLQKSSRTAPAAFARQLSELEDPFWSHHYTLKSKATAKPNALFGKERIQDFVINTLHPLRLAEDAQRHWPGYAKISGGTPAAKVKRAAYRLFGDRADKAQFLKKAWQHQALLQIYQDFCLRDTSDCETCPFPEQLQRW